MKKIKLILTSSAIILAVVGAFALRENKQDCAGIRQYYFDGKEYKPAGAPGIDYLCAASADTCTYILEADNYMPCSLGTYTPLPDKDHIRNN